MKRSLGLAILALAAGCSADDPVVVPGIAIAVSGGNSQTVTVSASAATPLQVTVTRADGSPAAGIPVTWTPAIASGTVAPAVDTTDAAGLATTVYTAGVLAGVQVVRAAIEGTQPVTFTVTAEAAAAHALSKSSGDGQAGPQGQPLPLPLRVRVLDQFGNPVGGTTVGWAVTSGSGTLSAASSTSATDGYAAVTFTPLTSGSVMVSATAAGLTGSPAVFSVAGSLGVVLTRELAVPANYGLHDQFVRDGIAFLAIWNTGLRIYDVGGGGLGGSPANPVFMGGIVTATNGVSGGAAVHNAWWYHAPGGQKRYVFVGQEGPSSGGIGVGSSGDIHVVDVTNMAAPVEVTFYHMSGLGPPRDSAGVHNFWVDEQNEILYAAYYNGGVVALDVSGTLTGNLASREIARIRPGGAGNTYIWGVHFFNGSLYATDMLSGFWQLRLVGNAFQVLGVGNNVPDRFGSDQWVSGSYAYSGTWGSRAGRAGNALKIWQLGAGGAPVLVDSIVTGGIGTVSDVEVSADGKLLIFSAENGPGSGIYFYDLTVSPTQPAFMGRYLVSTGVHTATFAQINGRRYVFGAKNPTNPSLLILDVTAIGP